MMKPTSLFTRFLTLLVCCALVSGCDVFSPTLASEPGYTSTPMQPVPWVLPDESEIVGKIAEELSRLSGLAPDEARLVAAAANQMTAPTFEEAADHSARGYINQVTFKLYLPDIMESASSFELPPFSGVPREAETYVKAAISAYDRDVTRILGEQNDSAVPMGEITAKMTRASEALFVFEFNETGLSALAASILEAVRAPFYAKADASVDYVTARAAEALGSVYPVAYSMRSVMGEGDPWFRGDRLADYLAHARILRCEIEELDEAELYHLKMMLPGRADYLEAAKADALAVLDGMDHDARVPEIDEVFFEAALARSGGDYAYDGQIYDVDVLRQRGFEDIVVWESPDQAEPHANAACVFSPQLQENLFALMSEAQAACEEIALAVRETRYAEWNLPATQAFTKMPSDKRAPLVIETHGIQGYLIQVTPVGGDQAAPYTFFVRGGDTFSTYLPEGDYRVDYVAGERWLGTAQGFGEAGRSVASPDQLLSYREVNEGYVLRLYGEAASDTRDAERVP